MPRKTTHVVPNSRRGGWDVKKGGAKRASGHFDTKREAEKWGRQASRQEGSEFIVHRGDGTIEKADSHGNDPNPPKDRN